MTKIRRTTVAIAAMLLISASVVEARQESPENTQNGSPATAVKAESTAEPGGTATDSGVTRAAKAAGHGIERGAKAVAKGIGHGASAVGHAISRAAEKAGPSRSAAPDADK